MIFVQVVPDRHKDQMQNEHNIHASGLERQLTAVRRPTRGIQLRDDTFATLRVVAGSGKLITLVDAGAKRSSEPLEIDGKRATDVYSNFLLQQINEERAEKKQILETFGEPYIFLFGQHPRIMSFQGVLLNTFDFNWEAEWWHNYDHYLRGTKCVENDARVVLSFDETLVSGYIINAAASKTSQDRHWIQFSFQMFLTSYTTYSRLGDPRAYPGLDYRDRYKDKNETFTDISNEEILAHGPRLLINGGHSPVHFDERGQPVMCTLAEGLERDTSLLNRVRGVWNSAVDATRGVPGSVGVTGGTVVKVVSGLSAVTSSLIGHTLNPPVVDRKVIERGGRIRFSTFDENYDEYVGFGDQYSSSVTEDGAVRARLSERSFTEREQESKRIAEEVAKSHRPKDTAETISAVSGLLVKGAVGIYKIWPKVWPKVWPRK
jgi:hypothetical protein